MNILLILILAGAMAVCGWLGWLNHKAIEERGDLAEKMQAKNEQLRKSLNF